MTMMQWFRSVRSARGAPASWRSIGRPAALVLFVLIGLSQTGCQSGLMSSCGTCGGKSGCGSPCSTMKSWGQRIFNRGGSQTIYGPAVPSAVPVEGMPPGTIVTPAPAGSGSTLLPGPAESATTPQLDPIPSATPGPPSEAGSTPTGAKSPTGKTNYEAARPRYRGGRFPLHNDGLARTFDPTPEPTTASARGSAPAPRSELDLVTNLPPLELPRDARKPTAAPAPAPADSTETPTPPAPSEVNVAPIARFTALDGRLSGGALPTNAGLDWLVEKGYRTILDLREPSERQPSFIAEVTNRGLRYVALPISVKTVDADHLSHFNLELAMADARPLYFFDTDGTRAGVLWYVRRLTLDKVDPQVASREAEELGLGRTNTDFWKAAQSLVENPNGPKPAPEPPKAAPAPAPADEANSPAPATTPDPAPNANPAPTPTAKPEASMVPDALDALSKLARVKQEPAPPPTSPSPSTSHDPTAWRPYAAMLLTALGVPLAYLSRMGWHGRRVKKASLPGTGRKPRSLPAASGE